MALSFVAGWLVALGPVQQAIIQLHRDIRAVNAQRPLVVHPINFWAGLAGFIIGMLVLAVGNRVLAGSAKGGRPTEFAEETAPDSSVAYDNTPPENNPS